MVPGTIFSLSCRLPFTSLPAGMAVLVLSPAEQTAAMLAGTSELKYLLARENVSTKIQALFYHVGAVTLARFSTFASSEAELKEVLKDASVHTRGIAPSMLQG